jgi:hypothetical protein
MERRKKRRMEWWNNGRAKAEEWNDGRTKDGMIKCRIIVTWMILSACEICKI